MDPALSSNNHERGAEMLMVLIGGAVLFGVSGLFALGIGKAIALGNDFDAPQHVNRSDWQRAIKPVRRS
jgi:hypothetical protein